MLRLERLEREDAAAGEERSSELEGGVLGGGADKDDGAVLDGGEEGVLLGFGESVNLVDEEDGASTVGAGAAGAVDGVAKVADAGGDSGEGDECVKGAGERGGESTGESGLAGAGRAPEDEGGEEGRAYEGGRAEEVVLADNGVEGARAHPVR